VPPLNARAVYIVSRELLCRIIIYRIVGYITVGLAAICVLQLSYWWPWLNYLRDRGLLHADRQPPHLRHSLDCRPQQAPASYRSSSLGEKSSSCSTNNSQLTAESTWSHLDANKLPSTTADENCCMRDDSRTGQST